MRRRVEQRLAAYRDGEGSRRERRRAECRIEYDSEARRHVDRTEQLGRAVRDAWVEGPPPPAPEYLIAALRPELARVDEALVRDWPARALGWARWTFRPAPAFALVGGLALLLLFVQTPQDGADAPGLPADSAPTLAALPSSGALLANTAIEPLEDTTIYDLAVGDSSLMILQGADGSTLIWILEEPDRLSLAALDGWA